MMSLILQGGFLLAPIVLLSLAAVFLIFERSLYYWQRREREPDLTAAVVAHLEQTSVGALSVDLGGNRSPEARVIAAALGSGRPLARADHRRRLDYAVLKEIAALERHVPYLQSIANIATLLGLLGTVIGMIAAFLNMRASGSTDLTVLSGGIAQALITTAAGLTVAIPSTLFHHLFANHVQRTVARLNIAVSELTAYFAGRDGV